MSVQVWTDDLIEKILINQGNGQGLCLVCKKMIPIFNDYRCAFWKHQFNQRHGELLLLNFIAHQSDGVTQINKSKNLEKLEDCGYRLQGNPSDFSESENKRVKKFELQEEKFFVFFIHDLVSSNYERQAICYFLARIGKTTKEICSLNIGMIQYYIFYVEMENKFPHLQSLCQIIKKAIKKIEYIYVRDDEFLFEEKQLRKELIQSKKTLEINNENIKGFVSFLKRIKLRLLNKIFQRDQKLYDLKQQELTKKQIKERKGDQLKRGKPYEVNESEQDSSNDQTSCSESLSEEQQSEQPQKKANEQI